LGLLPLLRSSGEAINCGLRQRVANFCELSEWKNVKQFSVFILAILATLTCGWANLGDGDDKVEDSYGAILQRRLRDDGTVSVLYHKDRYLYTVIFANGRSVSESYFHAKGTDLSEKEITRFLKANAGGATWTPESTAKGRRFKRSDGKAEATYGDVNGRPALTVRELHRQP
jgi:hypothetical protein